MNGKKYYEWSKHYDPQKLELECLYSHGIDFTSSKVLEVGCGTGRFTERILPICKEVLSIDPDREALYVLKKYIQSDKLSVELGTLETLQLKENYFDYVVFPWSMYLIADKLKNLEIAYKSLRFGGKLIVLQAKAGEYESEIAQLYNSYDSLNEYYSAWSVLEQLIKNVFGNVVCDSLCTYFYFDTIDQLIDNSLFFIEDEEGILPSCEVIEGLKKRLTTYISSNGQIKMTDIVDVFISKKEFKYE